MNKQNIVNAAAEMITDEELAGVVGGMTCRDGIAYAKFYMALGDVYLAIGAGSALAATNYGQALGVIQGACP